uniref:Uncharacterized protein n=1 Tax=Spongospora subterranea TaxID=70186 RepID=A0A0H5QIC6_9EUKA|eukprot:CRZ01387.1 hypothetical protein [Spongospora subterranea]
MGGWVMVLVWVIAQFMFSVYWTFGQLRMILVTWDSSSYAMPLGPLYGMLAWNIFQCVYFRSWLSLIFNVIWICCELVLILFTNRNLLRPDNPDFPSTAAWFKRCLIPISAIYFLIWVAFFLFAIPKFGEVILDLTGFCLSFCLSGAFILMLLSRWSSRQQCTDVIMWKLSFNLLIFLPLRSYKSSVLGLPFALLNLITCILDSAYCWALGRFDSKSTQSIESLSSPDAPVTTDEQSNSV